MKTEELKQGSPEWLQARYGQATASRISEIMAKTPSGAWGSSRKNYAAELILARLTEKPIETYTSPAMQWGVDTEPLARAAYEFRFDVYVEEVGFIPHPHIELSGASPDGLVGEDGLVGFKCPETATHIATLLGAAIPKSYVYQNQWEMACTGRQWCDWVSFDPRMPENMKLFCERIERDEKLIKDLEKEVQRFLDEVAAKVYKLKQKYGE